MPQVWDDLHGGPPAGLEALEGLVHGHFAPLSHQGAPRTGESLGHSFSTIIPYASHGPCRHTFTFIVPPFPASPFILFPGCLSFFFTFFFMVGMEWYSLFLVPIPPSSQWGIPEPSNVPEGDQGVSLFFYHSTSKNVYSYSPRDSTLEEPRPSVLPLYTLCPALQTSN